MFTSPPLRQAVDQVAQHHEVLFNGLEPFQALEELRIPVLQMTVTRRERLNDSKRDADAIHGGDALVVGTQFKCRVKVLGHRADMIDARGLLVLPGHDRKGRDLNGKFIEATLLKQVAPLEISVFTEQIFNDEFE